MITLTPEQCRTLALLVTEIGTPVEITQERRTGVINVDPGPRHKDIHIDASGQTITYTRKRKRA